jgi:hypothetical protein
MPELTFSKLKTLEHTSMSMVEASFRPLVLVTVLPFRENTIFCDIKFFTTKTFTDNCTHKHMPQSCQLTVVFICFDISLPAIHQLLWRMLHQSSSYKNTKLLRFYAVL